MSWGAVTPVPDQGQCGSCWACSTSGVEGCWEVAAGALGSFSEQQLMDCSKQNSSCNGDEAIAHEAIYNNIAEIEAHNAEESQIQILGFNQLCDQTLEDL